MGERDGGGGLSDRLLICKARRKKWEKVGEGGKLKGSQKSNSDVGHLTVNVFFKTKLLINTIACKSAQSEIFTVTMKKPTNKMYFQGKVSS